MSSIAEVSAVQNNFTRYVQISIKHRISEGKDKEVHTRQFHILILHFHKITIFAQLRCIKMLDSLTGFRQSDELWAVNANGVRENTASIDNSNRFVRRQ